MTDKENLVKIFDDINEQIWGDLNVIPFKVDDMSIPEFAKYYTNNMILLESTVQRAVMELDIQGKLVDANMEKIEEVMNNVTQAIHISVAKYLVFPEVQTKMLLTKIMYKNPRIN